MEEQQNEALKQRQNCCCLTGHRSLPSDPDRLAELRQNLRRLICDLAQQGITTFYTGGALGFDTMAAMMVLELKSRLPQLRLHLALPYPEQAKRWSRTDRLLYEQIKEHADRVYLVSMEYSAVCMKKRNYFMVDRSEACAYYMVNATRSGTAQTVNYARNQGCKLFDLLEKQPEWFVKTPQQQQISWSEQVIVRESYPAAQEKSDPEK